MLHVQVGNFEISKKSNIYSNAIIAPITAIPKKISIGKGLVGVGAGRREARETTWLGAWWCALDILTARPLSASPSRTLQRAFPKAAFAALLL